MQISPGIPTAAITLVIAFLVFAVLAGLLLGGQELLNPGLTQAEIRAMDARTSQQQREWALDMEYRRKQLEQDLATNQARREIQLAILEVGGLVVVSALGFTVLAAGAGLTTYFVSLSRREWATAQLIRQQQIAGGTAAALPVTSVSAMASLTHPPFGTAPSRGHGGNGHSGSSPPPRAADQRNLPRPEHRQRGAVAAVQPA